MAEVYLAIYDLSMGTAQQLSSMFLGPENSISMVPHTGVVAYNNEYFFSSAGVNQQNPITFRTTSGIQPIEIKLIGTTNKTKLEFENWLYSGNDVPIRFHGSTYKLLEHNCNTFSNYVLRNGFSFNIGVPGYILDVPRKVLSSPLGMMLASSMENMQPFGNTGTVNSTRPPQTGSTFNPPIPSSWQQNASTTNIATQSEKKMEELSNKIKSTPILDSHNTLLLSKDSSSFKLCIKKLSASSTTPEQKQALNVLEANFNDNKLSPEVSSDVMYQALYPFFLSDQEESDSSQIVIENESNILYSLMILRVLLLQNDHYLSMDLSPFIDYIIQLLISTTDVNKHVKQTTKSMAWCALSNAFYSSSHYTHIVKSNSLNDLCDIALQDTLMNASTANKNIISLKQSSSTFLYNLVHVTSFKQAQDNECILPDWCVNILCNISSDLENESDAVTQTRRIVILGKIIQKSLVGKELVKDIGLLYDISLENLVHEKNRILVKEVVTTCVD